MKRPKEKFNDLFTRSAISVVEPWREDRIFQIVFFWNIRWSIFCCSASLFFHFFSGTNTTNRNFVVNWAQPYFHLFCWYQCHFFVKGWRFWPNIRLPENTAMHTCPRKLPLGFDLTDYFGSWVLNSVECFRFISFSSEIKFYEESKSSLKPLIENKNRRWKWSRWNDFSRSHEKLKETKTMIENFSHFWKIENKISSSQRTV